MQHPKISTEDFTPEQIAAMREWLSDLQFADDVDFEELTQQQVVSAVNRHYEGGTAAFLLAISDPFEYNHCVRAEIVSQHSYKTGSRPQMNGIREYGDAVLTASRWIEEEHSKRNKIKVFIDDKLFYNGDNL